MLLLLGLSIAARSAIDEPTQIALSSLVGEYRKEHPEIPALYAFVAKGGRIVASTAVGTSDREKLLPATLDDQLRIGSNSKVVTSTLIGLLVDKGLLTWRTSIGQAFPAFAQKYAGNKGLNAELWHLLCHHGGIVAANVNDPRLSTLNGVEWRRKYLEISLEDPKNEGPSEKSIYGPGPIIAVAIAEKMTGKSFEELFEKFLGRPLGLRSFVMGFGPKTPVGWWFREDTRSVSPVSTKCNAYIANDPGGGICLSIPDLVKIYSLRAGVSYNGTDGTVRLSPKIYSDLNTAPWASLDGAALGMWYESELDTNWFGHAGNTGCGDWSQVSIVRDKPSLCFFHIPYNRPGDDPRPAFGWKDFLTRLRSLTLLAN